MIHSPLQKETGLESVSHSQLSRSLNDLDSHVLEEIFQQLLQSANEKTRPTKRNILYLIDSSTFSLSLKRHQWASFRKTKAGVKLYLTLCFMDEETMYPSDFTLTNANVYNFLKRGGTALEYFEQYKENKRRCGRTEIIFPAEEKEYIAKRSTEGWTPDVIIGRAERTFSCSVSTLYRRIKAGEFIVLHLPMQGKRKPNGYKEKRGK